MQPQRSSLLLTRALLLVVMVMVAHCIVWWWLRWWCSTQRTDRSTQDHCRHWYHTGSTQGRPRVGRNRRHQSQHCTHTSEPLSLSLSVKPS